MSGERELLKPFSPAAMCPKCLHDQIDVVYSTGGSWGGKSCSYSCPEKGHRREHLDRICQRCHYQWPEACAALVAVRGTAEGEAGA